MKEGSATYYACDCLTCSPTVDRDGGPNHGIGSTANDKTKPGEGYGPSISNVNFRSPDVAQQKTHDKCGLITGLLNRRINGLINGLINSRINGFVSRLINGLINHLIINGLTNRPLHRS